MDDLGIRTIDHALDARGARRGRLGRRIGLGLLVVFAALAISQSSGLAGVAIRAAAIYVFLWLAFRAGGKREVAQLTAFEFVVLVAVGDLIQPGVFGEESSIGASMVAVAVFVLFTVALSYVSWRFPASDGLIEGRPVIIVHNGRIDDDALRAERLPVSELLHAARQQGIEDIAQVRVGLIEPDGKISFFTTRDTSSDTST